MAPLAGEPRQLLVVLNNARRNALYQLLFDITEDMRAQLELPKTLPQVTSSKKDGADDAPLFVHPEDTTTTSSPQKEDLALRKHPEPPSRELEELRAAALEHFDHWRKEFLAKLKEITSAQEDKKVFEARKKRENDLEKARAGHRKADKEEASLIDFDAQPSRHIEPGGGGGGGGDQDGRNNDAHLVLAKHYHPVETRLATISLEDRKEILSCVLILLLSLGNYSAYSRSALLYLTSSLELPLAVLTTEETEVASSLVETTAAVEKQQMSADKEAQKHKQENQTGRWIKVGLASVAGAAIVGITGGLAAPVVAGTLGGILGGVGLGGVASFLGVFWANGALVGALFGAYGARMTGEMVDQYAREVSDFSFLPLNDEREPAPSSTSTSHKNNQPADSSSSDPLSPSSRRLRVTIGVNGWITSKDDVTKPWRVLSDESEVFALRFEMDSLLALGNSLEQLVRSVAWKYIKAEIIKRTVLATLSAALWPIWILKTASNIDNPFSLARNRAEKAGKILADALINRVQGERPVTLVGYSLGARAIYFCLRTLAERKAFGLVDTVVFIGAPIPSDTAHWQTMRSVVAGKMFNVFSADDYILGFLYRATSIQLGVAGLQEIQGVEGVENLDLSAEVKGHLRYPDLVGPILHRCGFPDVKGGEDGQIAKEEDVVVVGEKNLVDLELDEAEEKPPALPLRPKKQDAEEAAPPTLPKRPVVHEAREEETAEKNTQANHPSAEETDLSSRESEIMSSFDLHKQNHGDDDDDDDDDDHHGGGGIKMLDNDEI